MVESEQSCGSSSGSKGLENARYKLIKNEDKLILTDKKTLKSRVLEVEDIDYVVDDNQKLRDPNITENYFRLKDEPYTQQMVTKTADYVKEQKEADKVTNKIQQDIIEQFIKKHNLTDEEIKLLADIPAEINIKKFKNRDISDIKSIINDFKIMSKDLKDKIGTDVFNYLKAYFKSYKKTQSTPDNTKDKSSLIDYLKQPEHYSPEDYDKIKNKDIKDLYDVYKLNVEKFDNIDLKLLNNWAKIINMIYQVVVVQRNEYVRIKYYNVIDDYEKYVRLFGDKLTILPNPLNIRIYRDAINKEMTPIDTMAFIMSISNDILDDLIADKVLKYKAIFDLEKFISKIAINGIKYFNSPNKIKKINDKMSPDQDNTEEYTFTGKIYTRIRTAGIDYSKPRFEITSGENKKVKITALASDPDRLSIQGKSAFSKIEVIFKIIKKDINNVGEGRMASGWTDDTLSRIENIQTILNRYGFGTINPALLRVMNRKSQVSSGWTDDTLSRIENIQTILNRYGCGMKASGWTDDTLSRIEKINTTLSQYI
jgi:hypothetical protein